MCIRDRYMGKIIWHKYIYQNMRASVYVAVFLLVVFATSGNTQGAGWFNGNSTNGTNSTNNSWNGNNYNWNNRSNGSNGSNGTNGSDAFVGTFTVDSKCSSFSCKREESNSPKISICCPLAGAGNMKIVKDGNAYRIALRKYEVVGKSGEVIVLQAYPYSANEIRVLNAARTPLWRIVRTGGNSYTIDRTGWGGKGCNFGATRTSDRVQGSQVTLSFPYFYFMDLENMKKHL
eukprot:TRINITY_DN653_c0_g1_i18.p1 TRINITY_DN653_c0_g1~~TRINITY_DN653_c0_g1_i18.p1  ORF type:complete len:232 (+),score=63.00 TRINITY_DN653_c0_g1_i18:66-761(+)